MKNKLIYSNPISERIQKYADKKGITIYELCKIAGYKQGQVSTAARRVNSFGSAKMLYDFAQVLNITSDELISGSSQITKEERYTLLLKERDYWKNKYEELSIKVNKLKQNINTINRND